METLRQRALRFKMISRRPSVMDTIISFLRSMADSIEETLARCTDPVIVSELRYEIDQLRQKANELAAD